MHGHFAIRYLCMTFFAENEHIFLDLEHCNGRGKYSFIKLPPHSSSLAPPVLLTVEVQFMSCCL